jgi:hypothetical protein
MGAETTFIHAPSDAERNAGDGGSIRDLGAGRGPRGSALSQSVLPPSGDARDPPSGDPGTTLREVRR